MYAKIEGVVWNYCIDVYNFCTETWAKHNVYIAWSTSFFINRLTTRTPGESYRQSIASALVIGGVAAFDVVLRNKEYVEKYAITYGTMAVSYALPLAQNKISNILLSKEELNPVFAPVIEGLAMAGATVFSIFVSVTVGLGVGAVVNQVLVRKSIIPSITTLMIYTIKDEKFALFSGVASIIDELAIHYNATDAHYLSTASISYVIADHFIPQYRHISGAIAVAVSVIRAPREQQVLETFLPIESVKQSYSVLLEATGKDAKNINKMFETGLVSAANIKISSGALFLQILNMANTRISLLKVACVSLKEYEVFKESVKKEMLFSALRIIGYGILFAPMNSYILSRINKFVKDAFLAHKIYQPNNLIALSKNNYTAETYINDISTVITVHWNIYQDTMFAIPPMMKLSSLGRGVLIMPMVVGADYVFSSALNFMQEWVQTSNEQKSEIFSVVSIREKHDIEGAPLIVQGNNMDYMSAQWQRSIDQVDATGRMVDFVTQTYSALQEYWNVFVWVGVPVIVVKFAIEGYIAPDDVLESVFAIKESSAQLLINSKNKQELNNAATAIKRLNNFFITLANQKNIVQDVNIVKKDKGAVLKVKDLTYTRGSEESKITVTIPELSFEMGKYYAVTGSNGSGKSSFLLLLYLLLTGINEDSFFQVSGSITYPTTDLAILTQKDYCPVHSDLFGWVMSSNKEASTFSARDSAKMAALVSDLKFSPKSAATVVEEFKTQKANWCGELSGGQVKKVQLMKDVFMPEECPKILLLDETLGALDAEAKIIVQAKIVEKCSNSLVITVYHHDNLRCVIKSDLFEVNIHFENGTAFERNLCGENNQPHETYNG